MYSRYCTLQSGIKLFVLRALGQLFAGGDCDAGDLEGSSPQFAFFEEGPGGTEEHPEEVQADSGGDLSQPENRLCDVPSS